MGNCLSSERNGNSNNKDSGINDNVVTSMSNSKRPNGAGLEEKKQEEDRSLLSDTSRVPLLTMSDLWAHDTRDRIVHKNSRTAKERAQFSSSDSSTTNFGFVNTLLRFMVGNSIGGSNSTLAPIAGTRKLWIGTGVDQSDQTQGILRPDVNAPGYVKPQFQRNLIFETLDTFPIINPNRSTTSNPPAAVNIPTTQYLVGVSTRYSSRIKLQGGSALSNQVIDDAVGYWLFDVTPFIVNSNASSITEVKAYLCLANYHGVTSLYSGILVYDPNAMTCTAMVSAEAPESNSQGPGLAYTKHLKPFNSLADSPKNSWGITAVFSLNTGEFKYTRTKSAHPATINFTALDTSSLLGIKGANPITTPLFATAAPAATPFTFESSTPGDYITSINCNTALVGTVTLGPIAVTFASNPTDVIMQPSPFKLTHPSQTFVCDKGITSVIVSTVNNQNIDTLRVVSSDGRSSVQFGATVPTGTLQRTMENPEPENTIVRNGGSIDTQPLFRSYRLVKISGTFDTGAVNQIQFVFEPVYLFPN